MPCIPFGAADRFLAETGGSVVDYGFRFVSPIVDIPNEHADRGLIPAMAVDAFLTTVLQAI